MNLEEEKEEEDGEYDENGEGGKARGYRRLIKFQRGFYFDYPFRYIQPKRKLTKSNYSLPVGPEDSESKSRSDRNFSISNYL